MSLDINCLVDKKIEFFSIVCDMLNFVFEDNTRLNIYSFSSFWRLTNKSGIIMTSNDFYVRSNDYWGMNYVPLSDDLLDEIESNSESDDEYYRDLVYEKLSETNEEREEYMSGLFEGTTVKKIDKGSLGDIRIYLSNGLLFEVYSAPYKYKEVYAVN